MNFKPKKILFTSLPLEIWRTPSPRARGHLNFPLPHLLVDPNLVPFLLTILQCNTIFIGHSPQGSQGLFPILSTSHYLGKPSLHPLAPTTFPNFLEFPHVHTRLWSPSLSSTLGGKKKTNPGNEIDKNILRTNKCIGPSVVPLSLHCILSGTV